MNCLKPITWKRFFRAPALVLFELGALGLLGVVGAICPQASLAAPATLAQWYEGAAWKVALAKWLALDHVFRSPGFLILAALTALSLCWLVAAQLRQLPRRWRQRLGPEDFRSAPWRIEFERPASAQPLGSESWSGVRIWTENKLGSDGSVFLHLGLLLIIVAGGLRALLGAEAAVELMEGERLEPTAQAWAAQWPGLAGQPFQLQAPVTLRSLEVARSDCGELRELKAQLGLEEPGASPCLEVALNRVVQAPGGRLSLGSEYGTAVLLEWQSAHSSVSRQALMLRAEARGSFAGTVAGPDGLRALVRAELDVAGHHPGLVEVRVMKGAGLVKAEQVRLQETLLLPEGQSLKVCGTPFWVRLRGSRDGALGLVYAGFILVVTGATLLFTLVRLDGCLVVTRLGQRERVFLALKPQRFAPLFQERFERLVSEQGGPASGGAGRLGPAGALRPALKLAALLMVVAVPLLSSCRPSANEQARQLVERYNRVVSEAYRRGDVRLLDSMVGPNEGKKLTGLIGVRLDLGLTLDSELLGLEITQVERFASELRVSTRERWRYRDLKIGTGQPVGEPSLDSYEMLYLFKPSGRDWVVDEIRFKAAPQVGRSQGAWLAQRPAPETAAPGASSPAQAAALGGNRP